MCREYVRAGAGAAVEERAAPRPGILLDGDGTIIFDHGYVGSVDRVELIPMAAEAIARFNRARMPVAVVTNQAGVARGFYGTEDVERVHRFISERLAENDAWVDLLLSCPEHADGVVSPFACAVEDRNRAPEWRARPQRPSFSILVRRGSSATVPMTSASPPLSARGRSIWEPARSADGACGRFRASRPRPTSAWSESFHELASGDRDARPGAASPGASAPERTAQHDFVLPGVRRRTGVCHPYGRWFRARPGPGDTARRVHRQPNRLLVRVVGGGYGVICSRRNDQKRTR
jgi:HAD superfamily hydrolase (TIGR01662 family)